MGNDLLWRDEGKRIALEEEMGCSEPQDEALGL